MFGPDLSQSVAGDGDVLPGLKAEVATVGVAALEDKFPGAGGKQQGAFLLNHRDALGADARSERMGDEAV